MKFKTVVVGLTILLVEVQDKRGTYESGVDRETS